MHPNTAAAITHIRGSQRSLLMLNHAQPRHTGHGHHANPDIFLNDRAIIAVRFGDFCLFSSNELGIDFLPRHVEAKFNFPTLFPEFLLNI